MNRNAGQNKLCYTDTRHFESPITSSSEVKCYSNLPVLPLMREMPLHTYRLQVLRWACAFYM